MVHQVAVFLMHVLSVTRTKEGALASEAVVLIKAQSVLWWLYFGWSRLRTQECAQEMECILGVQISPGASLERRV